MVVSGVVLTPVEYNLLGVARAEVVAARISLGLGSVDWLGDV